MIQIVVQIINVIEVKDLKEYVMIHPIAHDMEKIAEEHMEYAVVIHVVIQEFVLNHIALHQVVFVLMMLNVVVMIVDRGLVLDFVNKQIYIQF